MDQNINDFSYAVQISVPFSILQNEPVPSPNILLAMLDKYIQTGQKIVLNVLNALMCSLSVH